MARQTPKRKTAPVTTRVGEEQITRRAAALVAREAPELKARVEEHPPGMLWVVVEACGGRTLCFGRGDEFWVADLREHLHGGPAQADEETTTGLPSDTEEPRRIAAVIIAVARGQSHPDAPGREIQLDLPRRANL